jgi:hypothetical protein
MSIVAIVENDTIKLPEGIHLEDGTVVRVEEVAAATTEDSAKSSFAERFGDLIGSVETGLGDLAINHDHYLHGVPKQKP